MGDLSGSSEEDYRCINLDAEFPHADDSTRLIDEQHAQTYFSFKHRSHTQSKSYGGIIMNVPTLCIAVNINWQHTDPRGQFSLSGRESSI